MNIVVVSSSSKVFVRPDTTWERDNEDLYVPEFVNAFSWTPVLFAKVSKPGRSVSARFADRYYDSMAYGVLLYPDDLMDGSCEGFASASCLDHTSFLPTPLFGKDALGDTFLYTKDGEELFTHGGAGRQIIEEAIELASRYCYIRTGDLIAIELGQRTALCRREDGVCAIGSAFKGQSPLEFRLIF